eukprot:4161329-Pleurochrysis_carterae.AAC.1
MLHVEGQRTPTIASSPSLMGPTPSHVREGMRLAALQAEKMAHTAQMAALKYKLSHYRAQQ